MLGMWLLVVVSSCVIWMNLWYFLGGGVLMVISVLLVLVVDVIWK